MDDSGTNWAWYGLLIGIMVLCCCGMCCSCASARSHHKSYSEPSEQKTFDDSNDIEKGEKGEKGRESIPLVVNKVKAGPSPSNM